MEIKLHPRRTVKILASAMGVLMLLHLIGCIPFLFMGRAFPLGQLNMDGEQNPAAAFSTALLWLCALLSAVIGAAEKREGWRPALPWFGLAAVFLGMGVDEYIELHERFSEPLRELLNTNGVFLFAWVIPYALFALLFGLLYARFVFKLPSDTRKYIIIAAALYLGGTLGMEMIGGVWMEGYGRTMIYYLLAMMEETLEMSGCIVFIYAFLNHIDRHLPGLALRVNSA